MKVREILGASLAMMLAISAVSFAADGDKPAAGAGDKPGAVKPEVKGDVKGVRLIKPFSDLKDLSGDQTLKLKEIHKKFADQIKALEAQQKEEMTAVLTDAQKKELTELEMKVPKGKGKDAGAAAAGPAKDPAKDPAK